MEYELLDNGVVDKLKYLKNQAKDKVAAIVVPHPDDFDILVGHPAQYLIKHGFKVYEILMTGGEYGLVNRGLEEFAHLKGKPLRKIRKMENDEAKRRYGVNPNGEQIVKTVPLGYIDGYSPFNRKSVKRLAKVFKFLSPSIIMGPDPLYSIDWHHDHMMAADNTYFAVREVQNELKLSHYYAFQTYNPNIFIPEQSWDIFQQSLEAHRSQLTPLSILIMKSFLKNIFYRLKRHRVGLRLISFEIPQNISSLLNRIKHHLFCGKTPAVPDRSLYFPQPEKLGLKRIPDNDALNESLQLT